MPTLILFTTRQPPCLLSRFVVQTRTRALFPQEAVPLYIGANQAERLEKICNDSHMSHTADRAMSLAEAMRDPTRGAREARAASAAYVALFFQIQQRYLVLSSANPPAYHRKLTQLAYRSTSRLGIGSEGKRHRIQSALHSSGGRVENFGPRAP